jgi:hypothetical protein
MGKKWRGPSLTHPPSHKKTNNLSSPSLTHTDLGWRGQQLGQHIVLHLDVPHSLLHGCTLRSQRLQEIQVAAERGDHDRGILGANVDLLGGVRTGERRREERRDVGVRSGWEEEGGVGWGVERGEKKNGGERIAWAWIHSLLPSFISLSLSALSHHGRLQAGHLSDGCVHRQVSKRSLVVLQPLDHTGIRLPGLLQGFPLGEEGRGERERTGEGGEVRERSEVFVWDKILEEEEGLWWPNASPAKPTH